MKKLCLMVLGALFALQSLPATPCCRKIDVAPVYTHIDELTFGTTTNTLNLYGIRSDLCWVMWQGLAFKPMVMYTAGQSSELFSSSIGFGWYIPLNRWNLTICPLLGANYTFFRTQYDAPLFGIFGADRQLRSWAPYTGIEILWAFKPYWRLTGTVQYAWTWARTSLEFLEPGWSTSNGPIWGILLERDINRNWSVNVGAGYNESLDEDRHGIRIVGGKIGLAYWF